MRRYRCEHCGHIVTKKDLDDECTVVTLAGIRFPPDMAAPDEYGHECPECGEQDSFEEIDE